MAYRGLTLGPWQGAASYATFGPTPANGGADSYRMELSGNHSGYRLSASRGFGGPYPWDPSTHEGAFHAGDCCWSLLHRYTWLDGGFFYWTGNNSVCWDPWPTNAPDCTAATGPPPTCPTFSDIDPDTGETFKTGIIGSFAATRNPAYGAFGGNAAAIACTVSNSDGSFGAIDPYLYFSAIGLDLWTDAYFGGGSDSLPALSGAVAYVNESGVEGLEGKVTDVRFRAAMYSGTVHSSDTVRWYIIPATTSEPAAGPWWRLTGNGWAAQWKEGELADVLARGVQVTPDWTPGGAGTNSAFGDYVPQSIIDEGITAVTEVVGGGAYSGVARTSHWLVGVLTVSATSPTTMPAALKQTTTGTFIIGADAQFIQPEYKVARNRAAYVFYDQPPSVPGDVPPTKYVSWQFNNNASYLTALESSDAGPAWPNDGNWSGSVRAPVNYYASDIGRSGDVAILQYYGSTGASEDIYVSRVDPLDTDADGFLAGTWTVVGQSPHYLPTLQLTGNGTLGLLLTDKPSTGDYSIVSFDSAGNYVSTAPGPSILTVSDQTRFGYGAYTFPGPGDHVLLVTPAANHANVRMYHLSGTEATHVAFFQWPVWDVIGTRPDESNGYVALSATYRGDWIYFVTMAEDFTTGEAWHVYIGWNWRTGETTNILALTSVTSQNQPNNWLSPYDLRPGLGSSTDGLFTHRWIEANPEAAAVAGPSEWDEVNAALGAYVVQEIVHDGLTLTAGAERVISYCDAGYWNGYLELEAAEDLRGAIIAAPTIDMFGAYKLRFQQVSARTGSGSVEFPHTAWETPYLKVSWYSDSIPPLRHIQRTDELGLDQGGARINSGEAHRNATTMQRGWRIYDGGPNNYA